ncbi:hypothetical protein ANCCAN_00733 [Ancylostoma caninum]|uniref:Uncharacterized protein n=1 Tax=Ancylostoma caninum TaxID=29170 RepID=A0A368HC13_ANCCA|nr:hypothetical protein ANCCAN_00733 [Ancylostoma caninum]
MSRFYIILTVLLALSLESTAMFEGGFGDGFGHGFGHGWGGWGPWKHRKAARKHKKNHH